MHKQFFIYLFFIFCITSCKKDADNQLDLNATLGINKDVQYKEPFRPQFHFSPAEKWMNDPNGLVYNDGVYHLFYQYYPEDIVWGPMHWGHAISKDLINWEQKPIALFPDDNGYIFSGSAVVDTKNTSGFGTKDNPPLVAIFTYHDPKGEKAGEKDFQTQGIAYSKDNGDTWEIYSRNPVIRNRNRIKDFRDPKVFWHEKSKQWIMALVAGDHVKFYRSRNLKSWQSTGEFGKGNGAHGGVWECPDIFKLKVEGTDEEKWVLISSINPGAPNGGSGTQYFVGDFNGRTFKTNQTKEKWIDFGTDNYAGVTYNNLPNNDRVFIGWMSNWSYARDTPTERWRSAMTLPRTLTLHKDIYSNYYLKSYPVKSFDNQVEEYKRVHKIMNNGPFSLQHSKLSTSEINFKVNLKDDYTASLKNKKGDAYIFKIDPVANKMSVDRRKSGLVDFEKSFAGIHEQPFNPKDTIVNVRMLVDRSSVEVFVDEGRYVFTEQVFPKEPFTKFEIASESAPYFKNINVFLVKSIWETDEQK